MGIDVEIYFELLDGDVPPLSLFESGVSKYPAVAPEGATHEISSFVKYYGIGYERGPWPQICADLMTLMQAPNIGRVWYSGDHINSPEGMAPTSSDDICDLVRHYIQHGHRPYRAAMTRDMEREIDEMVARGELD